jgi:hypothetical protein
LLRFNSSSTSSSLQHQAQGMDPDWLAPPLPATRANGPAPPLQMQRAPVAEQRLNTLFTPPRPLVLPSATLGSAQRRGGPSSPSGSGQRNGGPRSRSRSPQQNGEPRSPPRSPQQNGAPRSRSSSEAPPRLVPNSRTDFNSRGRLSYTAHAQSRRPMIPGRNSDDVWFEWRTHLDEGVVALRRTSSSAQGYSQIPNSAQLFRAGAEPTPGATSATSSSAQNLTIFHTTRGCFSCCSLWNGLGRLRGHSHWATTACVETASWSIPLGVWNVYCATGVRHRLTSGCRWASASSARRHCRTWT